MSIAIYILVMAGVTYLIRMLPLALFRKKIKSRFFKSVLYYIPYAVLSAMTFPSILFNGKHRHRRNRHGCCCYSCLFQAAADCCFRRRLRRGIRLGIVHIKGKAVLPIGKTA